MAMVNLSERPITCLIPKPEISKESNLKINNEINKSHLEKEKKEEIKQQKYPFNSNSPGHNLIINKNISMTPGPGTYEDVLSLKPKPPVSTLENNLFVSKSPRFQSVNLSEENYPGPGSYNISNIFEEKKINKRKKINKQPYNNFSLKFNNCSFGSVSTIPTKEQKFGYLFDENGDLIIAEDPEKDEKFSGKKNDCVGPGRYNPILLKENNQIVDWGKMSERILKINYIDDYNQKYNNNKDDIFNFLYDDLSNISKEETESQSILNKKNKSILQKQKNLNFRKQNIEFRNKLFHKNAITVLKKDKKTEEDEKKEMEDLYKERENKRKYPLNFNLLRYHYKPEKFQFFGSSSQRNYLSLINKDQNNNIGPGSYFNNNNNKNITKKLNKSKSQVNYKIDNEKIKKKIEENLFYRMNPLLGPGSYNLDNSMIKKSFSNFQGFSSEKRDSIKINEELNKLYPGPGYYSLLEQFDDKKMKKNYINKAYYVNLNNSLKKNILGKNEEKKPDFNYYQNNKFLNNLQNNIESRINKYQNKIAPFSSMEKRFNNEQLLNSCDLGPGKYNIQSFTNQRYSANNIFKPPFNSSSERDFSVNDNNIGPGRYDCDNYFNWNKKSFNIRFI